MRYLEPWLNTALRTGCGSLRGDQPALSMQIRELERELKIDWSNAARDRSSSPRPGWKWRGRASAFGRRSHLVDFPRRSGRLLSGNIKLGIIPRLRLVLPKLLRCQDAIQSWHLELHETPTKIFSKS